jgi:hypothetical protein
MVCNREEYGRSALGEYSQGREGTRVETANEGVFSILYKKGKFTLKAARYLPTVLQNTLPLCFLERKQVSEYAMNHNNRHVRWGGQAKGTGWCTLGTNKPRASLKRRHSLFLSMVA